MTDKIKVFISYAHGHKREDTRHVDDFAAWLRSQDGIELFFDRDHEVLPPDFGWTTWMLHSAEDAHVVLVVCSARYKTVFEHRAAVGGAGVAWESRVLTLGLYGMKGKNTRVYPIHWDGEDNDKTSTVPRILQDFDNDRRFPSGQSIILDMVRASFARQSTASK